jgi:dipeptidyl aminopeptidase/acylaminoacyl peptidase
MSIIERPGVFKCAVSIDNVYTDLFANWNRMPRRGQQERDAFTKVGVDPGANVLKDASPRWRARSIRHPILLIEPLQYFSNFAYAQYGNALSFVDELRQGGVDHKLYMVESSRSDNWLKDNDRQKSYFEVAKFLEQNLP